MEKSIDYIVRLVLAGKRVYARKWGFSGVFVLVFFASVSVLGQLDLLPETKVIEAQAPIVAESRSVSAPVTGPELPTKIEIAKIGLGAIVANPTTITVEALDGDLLKGAVRYPTSAKLGEEGNVVLFGHSSYLPVVRNQAYKTFNGIQKLITGDVVTISSFGTAYTYRVRSVLKENAAGDTGINLLGAGRVLTLVTCNSFAEKSDRFVVTADFVESHSIVI